MKNLQAYPYFGLIASKVNLPKVGPNLVFLACLLFIFTVDPYFLFTCILNFCYSSLFTYYIYNYVDLWHLENGFTVILILSLMIN